MDATATSWHWKNCWNCFSDCHCGGNVLDFVSKMENVDVHQAALLIPYYRETMRNLTLGEDAVRVEDIARSCRHVANLVLLRLGADVSKPAPETYAEWLLTDRPDGEAA